MTRTFNYDGHATAKTLSSFDVNIDTSLIPGIYGFSTSITDFKFLGYYIDANGTGVTVIAATFPKALTSEYNPQVDCLLLFIPAGNEANTQIVVWGFGSDPGTPNTLPHDLATLVFPRSGAGTAGHFYDPSSNSVFAYANGTAKAYYIKYNVPLFDFTAPHIFFLTPQWWLGYTGTQRTGLTQFSQLSVNGTLTYNSVWGQCPFTVLSPNPGSLGVANYNLDPGGIAALGISNINFYLSSLPIFPPYQFAQIRHRWKVDSFPLPYLQWEGWDLSVATNFNTVAINPGVSATTAPANAHSVIVSPFSTLDINHAVIKTNTTASASQWQFTTPVEWFINVNPNPQVNYIYADGTQWLGSTTFSSASFSSGHLFICDSFGNGNVPPWINQNTDIFRFDTVNGLFKQLTFSLPPSAPNTGVRAYPWTYFTDNFTIAFLTLFQDTTNKLIRIRGFSAALPIDISITYHQPQTVNVCNPMFHWTDEKQQ